jgi:hypothetical protein
MKVVSFLMYRDAFAFAAGVVEFLTTLFALLSLSGISYLIAALGKLVDKTGSSNNNSETSIISRRSTAWNLKFPSSP